MNKKVEIKETNKITCLPEWSWDSDSNRWSGYHIWYVYTGGATVEVGNERYDLQVGDTFLFDLRKNHHCTHNPINPLGVYTVYFEASYLLPEYIAAFHLKQSKLAAEVISHIVEQREEKNESTSDWLGVLLTEFQRKRKEDSHKHTVIEQVNSMLESHKDKMFTLTQMCDLTGYSKNQLIRVVKKDTGDTPIIYQNKYKINYAKTLLMYSNQPIAAIAKELGFLDANYFSKVFKQYIGMSPREFRN